MPAKPISFGELHFAKRGDAVAFLNSILQKYDIGDKVDVDDSRVLLSALSNHPEAKDKIGCGVSSFSVRSADYNMLKW